MRVSPTARSACATSEQPGPIRSGSGHLRSISVMWTSSPRAPSRACRTQQNSGKMHDRAE